MVESLGSSSGWLGYPTESYSQRLKTKPEASRSATSSNEYIVTLSKHVKPFMQVQDLSTKSCGRLVCACHNHSHILNETRQPAQGSVHPRQKASCRRRARWHVAARGVGRRLERSACGKGLKTEEKWIQHSGLTLPTARLARKCPCELKPSPTESRKHHVLNSGAGLKMKAQQRTPKR